MIFSSIKHPKYLLWIAGLFLFGTIQGQSFKKGSLNVSLSGGSTSAHYATKYKSDLTKGSPSGKNMEGVRDPLILEYGITDRWGIGMSCGNDLFDIDPSTFYGFSLPDNKKITAKTSELNFDLHYHIYSNSFFDFSTFTSVGTFGVGFSGKASLMTNGESVSAEPSEYRYDARGKIARIGTCTRLYVFKRFAVMHLLSVYTGQAKASGLHRKNSNIGQGYTTRISGYASEIGLSFRLLK